MLSSLFIMYLADADADADDVGLSKVAPDAFAKAGDVIPEVTKCRGTDPQSQKINISLSSWSRLRKSN
jgi:hypothetical protein